MQRESPTDAIVTTHPPIITNVTVVPECCAEMKNKSSKWFIEYKNYANLSSVTQLITPMYLSVIIQSTINHTRNNIASFPVCKHSMPRKHIKGMKIILAECMSMV